MRNCLPSIAALESAVTIRLLRLSPASPVNRASIRVLCPSPALPELAAPIQRWLPSSAFQERLVRIQPCRRWSVPLAAPVVTPQCCLSLATRLHLPCIVHRVLSIRCSARQDSCATIRRCSGLVTPDSGVLRGAAARICLLSAPLVSFAALLAIAHDVLPVKIVPRDSLHRSRVLLDGSALTPPSRSAASKETGVPLHRQRRGIVLRGVFALILLLSLLHAPLASGVHLAAGASRASVLSAANARRRVFARTALMAATVLQVPSRSSPVDLEAGVQIRALNSFVVAARLTLTLDASSHRRIAVPPALSALRPVPIPLNVRSAS